MDQFEMELGQWWGRSERYEEEQERLKRQFREMEEEYRLLSRLLQFSDGRSSVFKYLKRRQRKIADQMWAEWSVDLATQLECRS